MGTTPRIPAGFRLKAQRVLSSLKPEGLRTSDPERYVPCPRSAMFALFVVNAMESRQIQSCNTRLFSGIAYSGDIR